MESHVPPLYVSADGPTGLTLDLAPEGERDPSTWFGGVRVGARYVSCYLMALYGEPSLLDGMSPELRKQMQGKSSFHFTRVDEALLAELETLTGACLALTGGDPARGRAKRAHASSRAG